MTVTSFLKNLLYWWSRWRAPDCGLEQGRKMLALSPMPGKDGRLGLRSTLIPPIYIKVSTFQLFWI